MRRLRQLCPSQPGILGLTGPEGFSLLASELMTTIRYVYHPFYDDNPYIRIFPTAVWVHVRIPFYFLVIFFPPLYKLYFLFLFLFPYIESRKKNLM
jgi:hypothetical protein